jgi:solute carrier family 35 protein C2
MEHAASPATDRLLDSSIHTSDRAPNSLKHLKKKSRNRDLGEEEDSGSVSGSMTTSSDDFEMDDIDNGHGLEDDEETGLTSHLRRQRTRRKRRNTQLDGRVAPEDVTMKKAEDRLTNRKVWSTVLTNVVLIALWYSFSISISVVCTAAVFWFWYNER